MPDAAGSRIKFGVIVPSTNTVVEADYNRMAPHGVSFHTGRMYIEHAVMDSDAAFEALLAQIRGSIRAALERYGVRRIAVLSPYQPISDRQVTRYFEEAGFTVVRFKGLRCPTATSIAEVTEAELLPIIRDELNGPDVEAILQVGTNLSMVRLADEAERWLGKPVLAINAVTLWHALRANGIPDQMRGFGSLLREH